MTKVVRLLGIVSRMMGLGNEVLLSMSSVYTR